MAANALNRRQIGDTSGAAASAIGAFCSALALAAGPRAAFALAMVPVSLLLLAAPAASGAAGIVVLPMAPDLLGGGAVRVSGPDVLLFFAALGAIAAGRSRAALRALRAPLWLYTAALAAAVAAHLDQSAAINSFQRMQIVLVALAVGGMALSRDQLQKALTGYVFTASVLAIAWSTDSVPASFAFQKNPVGQYIAGALLVILWDLSRRLRLVAVVPLAIGLLQSESRGAILGLLVGAATLVVIRPGFSRRLKSLVVLIPFAALLAAAFYSLPDDVQARTATLSASDTANANGAYTIQIRARYRTDALKIIAAHPVLGVGIGQYLAGNVEEGTLTNDPHDVLLLEAAEGGLPLAGALTFLVFASCAACWRLRTRTPLAAVALAVQVATVTHGLLDVYWVRGTPVLGWLLVGAALAEGQRTADV